MSLDDRLREHLRRQADDLEPDAGRALAVVEARTRRRGSTALGALLAAAVVVLVVVGWQAFRSMPPEVGPGASGSSSASLAPSSSAVYEQIAGTYGVTLEPADDTDLADLAGSWAMTLQPTGILLLSPPQTFSEGGGIQSGVAFSIDGDRFRTNLFQHRCNSVGAYTWRLAAARLTLVATDDDCALRRTVLATRPWTRQ